MGALLLQPPVTASGRSTLSRAMSCGIRRTRRITLPRFGVVRDSCRMCRTARRPVATGPGNRESRNVSHVSQWLLMWCQGTCDIRVNVATVRTGVHQMQVLLRGIGDRCLGYCVCVSLVKIVLGETWYRIRSLLTSSAHSSHLQGTGRHEWLLQGTVLRCSFDFLTECSLHCCFLNWKWRLPLYSVPFFLLKLNFNQTVQPWTELENRYSPTITPTTQKSLLLLLTNDLCDWKNPL